MPETTGAGLFELLKQVQDVAGALTVSGLLFGIVIGAVREWWVPGRSYRRVLKERDLLLEINFDLLGAHKRGLRIAETLVTPRGEP